MRAADLHTPCRSAPTSTEPYQSGTYFRHSMCSGLTAELSDIAVTQECHAQFCVDVVISPSTLGTEAHLRGRFAVRTHRTWQVRRRWFALGRRASAHIPGILSLNHARRFWVLASFSLRSGAHVPSYAPLRCSRKPRQNAKLAGRAFLSVWASSCTSETGRVRPHPRTPSGQSGPVREASSGVRATSPEGTRAP